MQNNFIKNRLIWVDSIKGLLMFLVILGHVIQSILGSECHQSHIWNLIYSFHMPAFMAISGWLFYKSASKMGDNKSGVWGGQFNCITRRIKQLLIPYFAWSFILLLIRGNYTKDNFFNIILLPDKYLWFLWVLFWISICFISIKTLAVRLKISTLPLIIISCVTLTIIMVVTDLRVCGFQFIAYYFMFYALGYCIHRYESKLILLNSPFVIAVFAFTWFFFAWGWSMHGLPDWFPEVTIVPYSLVQYAYRGFTATFAILTLIGVAPKFLNNLGRINSSVTYVGGISLGMYAVHSLLLGYLSKFLRLYISNMSNVIYIIALFVMVVFVTLILISIISKNRCLSKILLSK